MTSPHQLQRYNSPQSLERLLLLLAVLVKFPGIGCKEQDEEETEGHHTALLPVQTKIRELAQSLKIVLPDGYPAIPTIRKDLELLRDYGLLERRMYRWGYYLGTGVFSPEELQIALNAIESQAQYQGHPLTRQLYQKLKLRLKGFQLADQTDLFYPVRQNLNRPIIYTDPQEMMVKQKNSNTLFHQLETVEAAIIRGQAIEIARTKDPYTQQGLGMMQLYPLQLVYYDIAWYLLCEDYPSGQFATVRIDRMSDYCQILGMPERGIKAQEQSLKQVHKLLKNGWGLKLGDLAEQQAELAGKLSLISVKVRFFPPISQFIKEGDRRHPRQKIQDFTKSEKDPYLDYSVKLPPRSLNEFGIWVQRYGDKAQVLEPPSLVEEHRKKAIALAQRYGV